MCRVVFEVGAGDIGHRTHPMQMAANLSSLGTALSCSSHLAIHPRVETSEREDSPNNKQREGLAPLLAKEVLRTASDELESL